MSPTCLCPLPHPRSLRLRAAHPVLYVPHSLPFDLAYQQLSSLPQYLPEAGEPLGADGTPLVNRTRNFALRNTSLCWLDSAARNICMAPHLDMVSYSTYNQKVDGVLGNGGYNSFFLRSYGVCDKEISSVCISQMNADLCLATAVVTNDPLTAGDGEAGGSSTSTMQLAVGLGVGLGGGWRRWRRLLGPRVWGVKRTEAKQGVEPGDRDDPFTGLGGCSGLEAPNRSA